MHNRFIILTLTNAKLFSDSIPKTKKKNILLSTPSFRDWHKTQRSS